MKKFALPTLLALAIAIAGCGNPPTNLVSTSTAGNWEAQMVGGTGAASQLNFVTAFSVKDIGPLDITAFGFFNAGSCFTNNVDDNNENGSATIITSGTGTVTGTLTYNVISRSIAGNSLSLTGNLTGNSNGTIGTTGTLTNGVVVGTWTLTGGTGCTGAGTFTMCQGTATCSVLPQDKASIDSPSLESPR